MQRVELTIEECAGVARHNWPVTQGIPFVDGVLGRDAALRLSDAQGRALPLQTRALATWRPDRAFVRWLLIDTCVSLDPGERRTLYLEIGHGPGFAKLQAETAAPTPVLPIPRPVLYVVDQRGRRFESSQRDEMIVEESGPLRVSYCIRGEHRCAGDGAQAFAYALRVHRFALSPGLVRVQHTFVFDQDPRAVELAEVGVRCAAPPGQRLLAVAVRDADMLHPKSVQLAGNGGEAVVQIWSRKGGDGGALGFLTPFSGKDFVFFKGTRDEAEFRRLIEEKPGAALNLKSTNAETREDLDWVERMVEKYAPDRPASYNDTGPLDGYGAAFTTEFWLRTSSDGAVSDSDARDLQRAVDQPVLAVASPAYIVGTGAVRLFAAHDPKRAAQFETEAESALEQLFERVVVEPRRILKNYGMLDYGDLMCSHSASPAALWNIYKDSPDVVHKMRWCSRAYNNEANDQVLALWSFFLHFGKREHYLAAEAYGRHMSDVDIIHAGEHRGLMHYHNAHHWSGGPSPSHTCMAGLMLQYYLSGDRRIFDVCSEIARWALGKREPCGIHSNRGGTLVREFTTPLANLLEYYQATWDEDCREMARRSLKWLLLAMPRPGAFPYSIYTAGENGDEAIVEQDEQDPWHLRQAGGMTPQLLYDAIRLFPQDPIYRDCLLAMARQYIRGVNTPYEKMPAGPAEAMILDPGFNAPLIAMAYELTRDPKFAAFCRYYVERRFLGRAQEMSFTYVCWGSIIPPLIEAVRRAERELGEKAIDKAEGAWFAELAERCAARPPVAQSPPALPRRSIGVIRGYDV